MTWFKGVVFFGSTMLLGVSCGAPGPAQSPTTEPGPPPTSPAPDPVAPPPAPTSPGPAPVTADAGSGSECSGPAPGPGYECVQNCGPPVASDNDPPPGFSWLSAADAANRRKFGCPICLPGGTRIATPRGELAVSELRVGDPIWTLDANGQRVAGRVLHAASTPISGPHHVVRLTLADGRVVEGSPRHPTLAGGAIGSLRAGDALSGSVVFRAENIRFQGTRTFDVLPSAPSAAYWADGVLLRSSFRH